jgi:hypothetical protein
LQNLALGKAADQSSLSEWSRGTTTKEDAAGAVSGTITGDAQFHTDLEALPWWSVDLGALHLVYEIRVFNRVSPPSLRERLGAFRIELASQDGDWRNIHGNDGTQPIGGADGYPLILRLRDPEIASRLRIIALGHTFLHLDQVEIYGVALS